LLCQGFERAAAPGYNSVPLHVSHDIPGIVSMTPNPHVDTLIGSNWCRLLSFLGKRGCDYMIDLLLECSLFCPNDLEPENMYQLSGK
jgi:hypothetical protein